MDAEVSKLKFDREKELILGDGAGFVRATGWEIITIEHPVLAVVLTRPSPPRRLGFRFLCDNWDELPPSLTLFEPDAIDVELPWEKWPKTGWNAGASHDHYAKPFLCLPGIREYHTHQNHRDDLWENLRTRNTYALRFIVNRVHQKFIATND